LFSNYKNINFIFVVYFSQALSPSKMAEKALAEDEANALLRKGVAELEVANAQLRLELDSSGDAAARLR
jgi:hypothetical protein